MLHKVHHQKPVDLSTQEAKRVQVRTFILYEGRTSFFYLTHQSFEYNLL